MDINLKELAQVASQIYGLENKLKQKREVRNNIAIQLMNSGKYSYRTIAKAAGFANPYLAQLRKKKNAQPE